MKGLDLSADRIKQPPADQAMLKAKAWHLMREDAVIGQPDVFLAATDREAIDGHRGLVHQRVQKPKLREPGHARRMKNLAGETPIVVKAGLDQQDVVAEPLDRSGRDDPRHAGAPDDHVDVTRVRHGRRACDSG